MHEPEYERIFSLEKSYWWHVARRKLVRRLIRRFIGDVPRDCTYLDLGCGTGVMLSEFGPHFAKAMGTDLSATALGFARTRVEGPLLQSDARHLPLADNQFDLITCLDIVEHIREDLDCVRESYRICKPGGHLVVSVPALDFLWGEHDEAVYHLRRYSWPCLRALLREAGFDVVKGTYAVMAMTPVVFLVRLVRSFTRDHVAAQGHDFPRLSPWMNGLLIWLHHVETWVSLRVGLPWGSGLVCVARKPLEEGVEDEGSGRG